VCVVAVAGNESIVFPDKIAEEYGTYRTPSPQLKGSSSDHGDIKTKEGSKPRFNYDTDGMSSNINFGVQPNGGGISGSASFSSSYGGHGQTQGHTASQSHSFNFQAGSNGFSASQAASQSSSFNSQFPGYLGYEARNNNTYNDLYIYLFLCMYVKDEPRFVRPLHCDLQELSCFIFLCHFTLLILYNVKIEKVKL
jgi:hypothetical protein